MANFEPDHPLGDSKCYRKKLETFNITDSLPGWRMSLLCRFITAKKKNKHVLKPHRKAAMKQMQPVILRKGVPWIHG